MKKFTKIFLLLFVIAGIVYACSENTEERSDVTLKANENPTIAGATIGYNDDNGSYVVITQDQLTAYWKYKFDIAEDVNFIDFMVLGGTSDTGDQSVIIRGRSDDGTINIASVLKPMGGSQNGMYLMAGGTCKCETNTCSWSGCEASSSGGSCYCSSCSGDCKKTSTVETSFSRVFSYL